MSKTLNFLMKNLDESIDNILDSIKRRDRLLLKYYIEWFGNPQFIGILEHRRRGKDIIINPKSGSITREKVNIDDFTPSEIHLYMHRVSFDDGYEKIDAFSVVTDILDQNIVVPFMFELTSTLIIGYDYRDGIFEFPHDVSVKTFEYFDRGNYKEIK